MLDLLERWFFGARSEFRFVLRSIGVVAISIALVACSRAAPAAPGAAAAQAISVTPSASGGQSSIATSGATPSGGAASTGATCPVLTAADVKSATGADARLIPAHSAAGAAYTCNFVGSDGKMFLGVDVANTKAAYDNLTPDGRSYPMKQSVSGLGDSATLYESDSQGNLRYLLVAKGTKGVGVAPATYPSPITDDDLKKLATMAIGKL